MKLEDAKEQGTVAYVPTHANGDIKHADVEYGHVSSKNSKFVFVKFDKSVNKLGWSETTAQACSPDDLVLV